jgi:putative toxin-antitoxin system antitoxin component (TIGR02293 family)
MESVTPKRRVGSEASRMAAFLGLPRADRIDDLELVALIAKGLPTKTTETVVRRIDPREQFLRATDIFPKSTYRRRVKARSLSKEESERLFALSKVFALVLQIYDLDTELAAQFLTRAHPLLGGRSPLDLAIESSAGADLVIKLMNRIDAGVAV